MDFHNFISLVGFFTLTLVAWIFSSNRKAINWHVYVWGVSLQFLFAWILFVVPAGVQIFQVVNKLVIAVMDSSVAGSQFLFGRLALAPGSVNEAGETSLGFFLGFQALPSIIFFSSLMSILYFCNVLPRIIRGFAFLFTKLMKISGAESLCAASNIFVGVESALTVKPFLKDMTKSELCTVLTAGMATVSSNILAVYVFSLQETFPNIAGHLVSASFLSAPAALVMSKMLVPEDSTPVTLGEAVELNYNREDTLFEAIINGAQNGVKLIVGIAALLIAVLGLVALFDQVLGFVGGNINTLFSLDFDWTLKNILGILFLPVTYLIGVPAEDVGLVSQLIAQRLVVTEVVSYQELGQLMASNALEHPRSIVLTTYALCGFAHFASLAIFVGGIAALVPSQTKQLAQVAMRSLAAATLACLMTATMAGLFYTRYSMLIGTR